MGRGRALIWALAISLLLHLALLGPNWLVLENAGPEPVFPIEASLRVEEAPVARSRKSLPVRPAVPVRPASAPVVEAPEMVVAPIAETDLSVKEKTETELVPVEAPVAEVQAASMVSQDAPPVAEPEASLPARPALRRFEDKMVLRYRVSTGSADGEGFLAGRATYIWHSREGRYSLVSTAEATGVAALFVSGRIVQVSEGEIDAGGLRPHQYWLQRGDRKKESARFDWAGNRLSQSGRDGVDLKSHAQDLLSFPFHIAMTARFDEPEFTLWVASGRKFRDYVFRNLGMDWQGTTGSGFEALHLRGARAGEGTLDVWLDLARAGLPVRIRTTDHKGKTTELLLEAEVPESGGDA